MKPGPNSPSELSPLLAFGAHPDDIEFGVGGVIAKETALGRPVHLVIGSRGESASHGTPEQRAREAEQGAKILGAMHEFVEIGGDAHFELRVEHAITLAKVIRRIRPGILLAPTTVENQHPDHTRLGALVRDAARLARYGGVAELKGDDAHSIESLFHYAVGPEGVPRDIPPVLIDVSSSDVIDTWKRAMEAHASQTGAREYVELQMNRSRLLGVRAGIGHAIALYPGDPVVVESLAPIARTARRF